MPYPHKFIKLTLEEKKQIKIKLKKLEVLGKSGKRKRLIALCLSDKGETFRFISWYLNVSYRTVKRWISDYRENGLLSH
ncbi:MAG: helix-turn-helix domain-containing protein [Planctomycetota bacterium]